MRIRTRIAILTYTDVVIYTQPREARPRPVGPGVRGANHVRQQDLRGFVQTPLWRKRPIKPRRSNTC